MAALLLLLLIAAAAATIPPAASQPAAPPGCNGVLLSYSLDSRDRIRPFLSDSTSQPYRFSATATVLNSGTRPLSSWSLLIGFSHREVIVSVDGAAALPDDLPFNTSLSPSPTSFLASSDLKTPIATAGDFNQIQARVSLIGTLFGSPPPSVPLPSSLSLSDPFFLCPAATTNTTTSISTCCLPDPKFRPNGTVVDDDPLSGAANGSASFLPRRSGDLTFSYDVLQAYSGNYLALVTLQNHHPLGRLDSWRLSFNWTRGEFIYDMKGAYTSVTGAADCIIGPQGQYYQDLDFSKVANCQRRPTILDLPADRFNDTIVGRIPNCCRNGTILPDVMDASQSTSAFQLQVFKMPPDLNRTRIFPPQNWRIAGGALNPDFSCGAPVRVSRSQFPDPSGLQSTSFAIASWQVVCNITKPRNAAPKCCVSFSAYYNKSVVPCKTCACGCNARSPGRTCNASAPAMLLPPQALLVPFDNRTSMALEWASQKHFNVPRLLPCSDFCGVSINWHINSDYRNGWTSRITLFNWDETTFADWFAAVEMGNAYDGFEAMYSFNGSKIGDNTIFMQGLPGLNDLVGEVNGTNPERDPRIPGKQQSVISFTKKNFPYINVAAGDGFPTKVIFNGEECALPDIIPSQGFRTGASGIFSLLVLVALTALLIWEQ